MPVNSQHEHKDKQDSSQEQKCRLKSMKMFPSLDNREDRIFLKNYGHSLPTRERVSENFMRITQCNFKKFWFISLFYQKCLKFLLGTHEFPE